MFLVKLDELIDNINKLVAHYYFYSVVKNF